MVGVPQVMAKLLYGSGVRGLECVRVRVKDVDVAQHLLLVRDDKGEKDRITMLPETLVAPLQEHLVRVKQLHTNDLAEGYGAVYLPYALERKYPNANWEWGWQYVFPAKSRSVDPRTGIERRHHLDESSLQKAIRAAARLAGIAKHVTCHTFRNVSPHYSSFVDNSYLLPAPSLLWSDGRNRPMVTTADLGESDRHTPGWP